MKKFLITLAFLIVSCAIAFAENPNLPTQNGEPVVCNFGPLNVATPTITIHNSIVMLAGYLPAGTIGFELRCASGSFVIGHPDDIATGTNRVGRLVSTGDPYSWNNYAGSEFPGAVLGTASDTVIVIDAVWGRYEP